METRSLGRNNNNKWQRLFVRFSLYRVGRSFRTQRCALVKDRSRRKQQQQQLVLLAGPCQIALERAVSIFTRVNKELLYKMAVKESRLAYRVRIKDCLTRIPHHYTVSRNCILANSTKVDVGNVI